MLRTTYKMANEVLYSNNSTWLVKQIKAERQKFLAIDKKKSYDYSRITPLILD